MDVNKLFKRSSNRLKPYTVSLRVTFHDHTIKDGWNEG